MNDFENHIQAGTRFISSEMQDAFDHVIFLVPNWKWAALLGCLISLYFLRFIILSILTKAKTNQAYFPDKTFMQFFFQLPLEKGISWALVSLIGILFVESLMLTENLSKYLVLFFKLILAVNIIRICYLAAEAFGSSIQEWAKTTESQIDDQLAPLATKTMKVLVILIGALIVLQNFGVNVTALLAGLGIGGVALAFAAQDTVANVFGTITILLDTPFKLGDKIKLGDTEGIVEEVGFRSTRIRTYYNSLVTLPNSYVAKEKIDNLTDRQGWIRFRNIIGVTYDAKPEQIKLFCENLKYDLLQDETVDHERISISFNGFGDSSLNILINFHYRIQLDQDEMLRNQTYLNAIYDLTQKLNLDFAYPTRTMIVRNAL